MSKKSTTEIADDAPITQVDVDSGRLVLRKRGAGRVTRSQTSIVELLAMPGVADIDFEPPRLSGDFFRPANSGRI